MLFLNQDILETTPIESQKPFVFSQACTNDADTHSFASVDLLNTNPHEHQQMLIENVHQPEYDFSTDSAAVIKLSSPKAFNMPACENSEFQEETLETLDDGDALVETSNTFTQKNILLFDAAVELNHPIYENASEFQAEEAPQKEHAPQNKQPELLLSAPMCEEVNGGRYDEETADELELVIEKLEPKNEPGEFFKHSIETVSMLNAARSEITVDDENTATEFYDLPIRFERAETRQEKISLNSKPDKTLLLWLSYPNISNPDEETTRDLDEKLDQLYERIGLDPHDELDTSSLARVEKILNVFVSNQESVEEFQDDILKLLPYSRPEIQQLILDRQMAIEVEESCELIEHPVTYVCHQDDEDNSFSEDSIEELAAVTDIRRSEYEPMRAVDSTSLFRCETGTFTESKQTSSPIPTSAVQLTYPGDRSCLDGDDFDLIATADSNRFSLSLNVDDVGLFYEQIDLVDDRRLDDECLTPIEIKTDEQLNETNHDDSTTSTMSSGVSDTSGKMHLIESVEVVTHHNDGGGDDEYVHVHKVDINRLKIKENPENEGNERFRVKYKQEELLDLRDKLTDDERLDLSTNKLFARKFVEQIIHLSSKKLASIEALLESDDETITSTAPAAAPSQRQSMEATSFDINTISNKTTSEILDSLNNLREDFGKHLVSKGSGGVSASTTIMEDNVVVSGSKSDEVDRSINLTANDSNEFKVSQC